MVEGIDGTAKLLNANGISTTRTRLLRVHHGSKLIDLPDNNLESLSRFVQSVDISSPTYLLPRLCNFPVIDSVYLASPDVRIMFQMKAGNTGSLSTEKAKIICHALGNFFVVVVPSDNVVTKKLDGGPEMMQQYVFVLSERTY
jgi:hypothetical protein